MGTVTTRPAASARLRWRPSAALQVAHKPSSDRRPAAALLAAIIALVATSVFAGSASATTTRISETAVAPQTIADQTDIGADWPASPTTVGTQTLPNYDRMSECCVAPTSALDDLARACSFSAGTEVLMAEGATKPISQIEIGDWVLAEDPETGDRGARRVTKLWVHEDTLVDLEINGVDVTMTEDHPFWNATDLEWQRADALGPGDLVPTADGDLLEVDGIDWTSTTTGTAYNLTINDLNTYYVTVGDEAVLVHNICPDIPGRPFTGKGAPEAAFAHLEKFSGLDPKVASNRLHVLKIKSGLGPAADVAIGRTGDVYDAVSGDLLGNLTDPGLGTSR